MDNSGRKANMAETNFMDLYILDDVCFDVATDLAAFMGELDVDMIHSTLEFHKILLEKELSPKQRLRGERNPELEIVQPLFGQLL